MRLNRQADFDRAHQSQVYAADEILVIRATRNELARTRMGVSVSRKVGNAVLRNRWKRLVREAFRLEYASLPSSLDLVIRPRRGAAPEATAIRHSLKQLVPRLAQRLRGAGK
jgi:ribonuclease P protein component